MHLPSLSSSSRALSETTTDSAEVPGQGARPDSQLDGSCRRVACASGRFVGLRAESLSPAALDQLVERSDGHFAQRGFAFKLRRYQQLGRLAPEVDALGEG